MRALAAVVVLSIISASPPAFAETWRTKVALMEAESPANCAEADVSKLFYQVTVTGNEFSAKTSSGETFSTPELFAQAAFDRQRRWLVLDLLTGRFDRFHPLRDWLLRGGAPASSNFAITSDAAYCASSKLSAITRAMAWPL